jgi:hypothetical protein
VPSDTRCLARPDDTPGFPTWASEQATRKSFAGDCRFAGEWGAKDFDGSSHRLRRGRRAAFGVGSIQDHPGRRGRKAGVIARRQIGRAPIRHGVEVPSRAFRELVPDAGGTRAITRVPSSACIGNAGSRRDRRGIIPEHVGRNQAVNAPALQRERQATAAESQQSLADRVHELDVCA